MARVLLVAAAVPAAFAAPGASAEPGLPDRLAALARDYDGRVFCAPRATRAVELAQAIAAFVHAHPELAGTPNDEQVLRGLAERYPCDPAGLSSRGPDARLRRAFEDIAAPLRTITPVFSQLLAMSFPAGFAVAPVQQVTEPGDRYLREHVLVGENADAWSEMISVTAARGLADQSRLSLRQFVDGMAGGYRRACPDSFVGASVMVERISGFETSAAIVSCGESPLTQGRHSESAMIVAIKGSHDYYTVQWAERGEPWSTPLPVDQRHWLDKFARLAPIRLCPRVAGEAPPYPSCINPAQ